MSDRIQVSRILRWKWFLDDIRDHWRLAGRLYVSRAYSWGRR